MATRTAKKWTKWAKDENIKTGPGPKRIRELVYEVISGPPKATEEDLVMEFGTTKPVPYRVIPILITKMVIKRGLVDFYGKTYYPDFKKLHGRSARVLKYNPQKREAEKVEILE
jgi:hypothetical protein